MCKGTDTSKGRSREFWVSESRRWAGQVGTGWGGGDRMSGCWPRAQELSLHLLEVPRLPRGAGHFRETLVPA